MGKAIVMNDNLQLWRRNNSEITQKLNHLTFTILSKTTATDNLIFRVGVHCPSQGSCNSGQETLLSQLLHPFYPHLEKSFAWICPFNHNADHSGFS